MAKKRWSVVGLLSLLACFVSSVVTGQSNTAGAEITGFYVINLGSQAIFNYKLSEWPTQIAGLDHRPGALLDGGNSGFVGQSRFDFYWQLADGRIYAQRVNARTRLPRKFRGEVMFSVHDDHVEVSWTQRNPEFTRQVREGRNGEEGATPFVSCDGPYFVHPLMQANLAAMRERVRSNPSVSNLERDLERGKCNFRDYFPRESAPSVPTPEEQGAQSIEMKTWISLVQDLMDSNVVNSSKTAIRIR
jgi:hypothetical protein